MKGTKTKIMPSQNSDKNKQKQGRSLRFVKMNKRFNKLQRKIHNSILFISTTKKEFQEKDTVATVSTTSSIPSNATIPADVRSISKRVSFGSINIKHFPVIMGDNPTCKYGPPLTLDWLPHDESEILTSVDDYEDNFKTSFIVHIAQRDGKKNPKLDDYERLSVNEREKILKESGYTSTQMRKELEAINIERMHRIRAMRNSDGDDKWAAIKVD